MLGKIIKLPFAIIKDMATLGGAINDGYFQNGNRSYTGKIISDINNEIELKENVKTVSSILKEIKKIL